MIISTIWYAYDSWVTTNLGGLVFLIVTYPFQLLLRREDSVQDCTKFHCRVLILLKYLVSG